MDVDHTSYWKDFSLPRFPKLDRDLQTDVVVIGGGLAGLTAAYLLKRAGRRVVLLERGTCAAIDTAHTTAHLTCVTDTRLTSLAKSFGHDHAQAVWDAGLAAIDQIEQIIGREQIDCGFARVPGYLHVPRDAGAGDDKEIETLKKEAELAASMGFDAQFVERVPLVERPGIEILDQARFHPRKYLAAMAQTIDGGGSFVFEHTNAEDVEDDPLSVEAAGHSIKCEDVVVLTHNPIVGKAGIVSATLLQTKLALYTSYVVAGRVASGQVPDALFWDTGDPYKYVRIDRRHGFDVVIFGGEDHKTGQTSDTEACFRQLTTAFRRLLPDIEITHRWSGQVIETNDGLPLIGDMAPHQFAATGFSGNGMTFGTLGAMMACDAIAGVKNPWRDLFDIGRTKIRGGLWDYLAENKDYPYYLIRDRFAGVESRSLRTVPRGAGQIVSLNGARVAAFRDADGSITLRSPVCTHMGCYVRWNPAESTWDCPCHGSRFSPKGKVISGPAESPLGDPPEASR
jgi:glycine/D-amino acid oxidase-like deaminating enzyme/nitrite reductase/ring-hydroxylating ferredoxin subunit